MVSDFVETEPIFETNENEIESITAIKFEIEYTICAIKNVFFGTSDIHKK